jgi:glycosyltransferase involved in cell wall biosynthesis
MRILFIAPLPGLINGQSKASKMALDSIETDDIVTIINLSKKSLKNGFSSFGRFFEILNVLIQVWKSREYNDLIYVSIAESFAGNLRDLFIYLICFSSRAKIVIHMLGGAGMTDILRGNGILSRLNRYLIADFGGVIVEGEVNFKTFSKVISHEKIHIIPNFADDFLFVNDNEIIKKFDIMNPIQILYLSNLIPGKGYNELASAYAQLSEEFQKKVSVNFVGGFESLQSEKDFLCKIEKHEGLNYLGKFIDGLKKRELYCKSHVFCLPTYYPFEGQPISILEAYATGCVVITSNHSGIPFVFSDRINGFMVDKKSISSLKDAIEEVVRCKKELIDVAFNNRDEAFEKYRISIYKNKISQVFVKFK